MFRSYRAYTAGWYRVLGWICYPLAAVLGCLVLQNGVFGLFPRLSYRFVVPQSMLGNCLCMVEIFLDAFFLGGVCSGKYRYHDLYKNAPRGKEIFKNIIWMDTLRRALLFLFLYLMNVGISVMLGREVSGEEFLFAVMAALYSYMLCTTAVLLTRFTMLLVVNLATAYGFMSIGLVLQAILTLTEVRVVLLTVIFGTVSVILTVLLIRVPMKKMEDSYYDH